MYSLKCKKKNLPIYWILRCLDFCETEKCMGEILIVQTSSVDSETLFRFKWDTLYIFIGFGSVHILIKTDRLTLIMINIGTLASRIQTKLTF